MTLRELSQLYYLNREIEMDQARLERLRASASNPSAPNLTGMPAGGRENRVERYVAEAAELEAIISAKVARCTYERNRLERYIAGIEDSLTRQIFTLRFINGLGWAQIAYSVGGGNTADGVRKRAYRYLQTKK